MHCSYFRSPCFCFCMQFLFLLLLSLYLSFSVVSLLFQQGSLAASVHFSLCVLIISLHVAHAAISFCCLSLLLSSRSCRRSSFCCYLWFHLGGFYRPLSFCVLALLAACRSVLLIVSFYRPLSFFAIAELAVVKHKHIYHCNFSLCH